MARIELIKAREVLDSRGRPTIEAEVLLEGAWGRAIAPSGASTGLHEAHELRDGNHARFSGWGVQKAVKNANTQIASAVKGKTFESQSEFDATLIELDGTPNKARLGANAILACSLAFAHAKAALSGLSLWQHLSKDNGRTPSMPLPMINILSGGLHAGRRLEFQDFLVVPHAAKTLMEALEWTHEIYKRALGACVKATGYNPQLVADEGGIGPDLPDSTSALKLLTRAVRSVGFTEQQVGIALDVASSHFYRKPFYRIDGKRLRSAEMVDYLERLADKFPIISIEDGLAEDDWAGWELLTARLGNRIQLLGDDLFVTNPVRLKRGIDAGIANAILIKLNQIGTLTETIKAVTAAHSAGYKTVISARSGETEDSTMSDLAVGINGGQIKIGSITRSSRLAKYNQLLRIEESSVVKPWKKLGWAWKTAPDRQKGRNKA